jgi:hypothetical protein
VREGGVFDFAFDYLERVLLPAAFDLASKHPPIISFILTKFAAEPFS